MFSLDLLLPGLNPKLEQKAILRTELLFKLVASLIPVISSQYEECLLAFPSIGDAAGFQKYCFQTNVLIPSTIILGDVDRSRVTPVCDCILFIASRNNVGDPVLREVQHIVEEKLGASPTYLFLNCDLSDKVTTGLTQRTVRDAFRARIKPAFHLRNIVTIQRPSLTPIELGMIIYTPSTGWRIYSVNRDEIVGPGSLNRFCDQAVFMRDPQDPTAANPPGALLVGEYFEEQPRRDDIEAAMARASFLAEKMERAANQRATQRAGQKEVGSVQEAVEVLRRASETGASASASVSAVRVLDAALVLANAGREGRFKQRQAAPQQGQKKGQKQGQEQEPEQGGARQGVYSIVDSTDATPVAPKQVAMAPKQTSPAPAPTLDQSSASAPASAENEREKEREEGVAALLRLLSSEGGRWRLQLEISEDQATFAAAVKPAGPVVSEWSFKEDGRVVSALMAGPVTVAEYKGEVDVVKSAADLSSCLHVDLTSGSLAAGLLRLGELANEAVLEVFDVSPSVLLVAVRGGATAESRAFQLWIKTK